MRPSKIKNYMDIARTVAMRSHDAETKVGSILVHNKSGSILSTGFNGFIRGADDSSLPTTRPDKYNFITHSEANLIYNCARHGISMDDCMVVCTMSPCKQCMRALFSCGITRVIAENLYKDFNDIMEMTDLKVEVTKDDNGFNILTYKV